MSRSHAVVSLLEVETLQICEMLGCLHLQLFFTRLNDFDARGVPVSIVRLGPQVTICMITYHWIYRAILRRGILTKFPSDSDFRRRGYYRIANLAWL